MKEKLHGFTALKGVAKNRCTKVDLFHLRINYARLKEAFPDFWVCKRVIGFGMAWNASSVTGSKKTNPLFLTIRQDGDGERVAVSAPTQRVN